jgi:isocitrate dehydrogenase kinase/phosphatase
VSAAEAIHRAFDAYHRRFRDFGRDATKRFRDGDWPGLQDVAMQRMGLYECAVGDIRNRLGRCDWARTKPAYQALIAERSDVELAETFFNSLTRRDVATIGVDRAIEFVSPIFDRPRAHLTVHRHFERQGTLREVVSAVLAWAPLELPFRNLDADAARVAEQIRLHRQSLATISPIVGIDLLTEPLYRGRHAFLVGRIAMQHGEHMPLAVSLTHTGEGLTVEATLLSEDAVSILFSFSRSAFLSAVWWRVTR